MQYQLNDLLKVESGEAPDGFKEFWENKSHEAILVKPEFSLKDTETQIHGFNVFTCQYNTTDGFEIGGWVLIPIEKRAKRAIVMIHGYGGWEKPDFDFPFFNAIYFFPCCRGISRSRNKVIPERPDWHVLYNIDKPDEYILGGCVQDVWVGISGLLRMFPFLTDHIGIIGESFGGGIGAFVAAFDSRVKKAHLRVPTFGNNKVRLKIPCHGSGDAVKKAFYQNPELIEETLKFYDASVGAGFIKIPTHFACALKDEVVPPPGQFSIFNGVKKRKKLFVLDEGHSNYINKKTQYITLKNELDRFFSTI
jgi:cephalosporin-C deacetylase